VQILLQRRKPILMKNQHNGWVRTHHTHLTTTLPPRKNKQAQQQKKKVKFWWSTPEQQRTTLIWQQRYPKKNTNEQQKKKDSLWNFKKNKKQSGSWRCISLVSHFIFFKYYCIHLFSQGQLFEFT